MRRSPLASRAPGLALVAIIAVAPHLAWAWNPLPVASDPLTRMPGTQPLSGVAFQSSTGCLNCHAAYAPGVEPAFPWRGSMMGQAARDPFFWTALTVAAQDSIYSFGRPNGSDSCLRCHMPEGWIDGRSDPTNGSALIGTDLDGVSCDSCHEMFDPFFADTFSGAREGSDWAGYWDESNLSSTPSQAAAMSTLTDDTALAATLSHFNGSKIYDANGHYLHAGYTENANGQYYLSASDKKRGPFADASPQHGRTYSRYHKSRYFCGTCHDVSNAALENLALKATLPNDGVTVLPTETSQASAYFPLERTFSEFMLSDYGLPNGSPGTGAFAPGVFTTPHPGDAIATCQDCHMAQATGVAAKGNGIKVRPTDSMEHSHSGQAVHDLTGGNALVPYLLASAVAGSPVFDATNAALLGQGKLKLTLDLTTGVPLDPTALLAGRNRALASLARAATIEGLAYDPATGAATFRIVNHTGHKLISGYPEGRRMFVNVSVFKAGALIRQVNPYDAAAGTLRGLPLAYSPSSPALGAGEVYADDLVYEAHPSSTITGEAATFHVALADGFSKDNRIPPKGFRIAEAAARQAVPAWAGAAAPGYFTAAEYQGGWDDVTLALPVGGDAVQVRLYYQTTSREYVEFLNGEITGTGKSLTSPTPSGEPKAYIAQTDPFFKQLAAWGDTVLQLWTHNKDVPGAAPVLMTQALFAIDACSGKPNGTACDDGNACTMGDACAAGKCAGGAAVTCDDGNVCTTDLCDPQQGCTHGFASVGCDDGNPCTSGDLCAFGVCGTAGKTDCSDGDSCTLDSCDLQAGCVHTPVQGCGGGGMGGMGGMGMTTSTGTGTGTGTSTSASTSTSTGMSTGTETSTGTSMGMGGMGGTGGTGTPGTKGGCGCAVPGERDESGWVGAMIAALAVAGRRRGRRVRG